MTRAVRYHVQASVRAGRACPGAPRLAPAASIVPGMAPPTLVRPDVLVLAGGGIVGEAWMHGVLAGIEDAGGADFRRVEAYVGTSDGSIVGARLRRGDACLGPGPGALLAARLGAVRPPPRPDATAQQAAPGFADEVLGG